MRLPSIVILLSLLASASGSLADDAFLTVAETSGYKATARHGDVRDLCARLAEKSARIHLDSIGTSVEGRSIPLLIIADPPVKSALQARQSGKLVVLLFGNIHAGEVCGKEALMMLAREIGIPSTHALLEDLIIALVPIFNTDGNEKISRDNRRNQVGPEEGMGERYNAQGLDLNRDWVKLEAPETRALMRFINAWDPAAIIDTHTTNGSHHRFGITYAGPKNLAGDAKVIAFVRQTMLPEISRRLETEKRLKTFFYGNFGKNNTLWTTAPDLPRFGTPYRGLRNRIAILSEAYSYSSFKDRVLDTRVFCLEILEYLAEHRQEIDRLIKEADARAIAAGKVERGAEVSDVPLRAQAHSFPEKITIPGYVEKKIDGKRVVTSTIMDYEVEFVDRYEPTLSVKRPRAYVLSPSLEKVVDNLVRHGIEIEVLREDIELDLEVYRIEKVERAERAFQKHHLVRVETSSRTESMAVKAGTLLVQTAQPLGSLVCYLLEPRSADGLCTWNFFDEHLAEGKDYPVRRIPLPSAFSPRSSRLARHPDGREPKKPITFELVYESGTYPALGGRAVSGLEWLDDNRYLERRGNEILEVDARTGKRSVHQVANERYKLPARALARLPFIDEKIADSLARRLRHDDKKTGGFVSHENDLYYCSLDGKVATRLTSTPGVEELATFSPDGRFVAYVSENDLRVVDVDTGTNRQLTTGGSDTLRNGKASWVYFEEVFNRRWKTYWWSPDSKRIAYMQVDSSPVKEFTIVDDLPNRQTVERSTFPKPGEPNPTARIGIVTVAGGAPRWADLSSHEASDLLITGVGWWPDSSSVYLYLQNRLQTWLDFCMLDPRGGEPTRLFRETTEAWVDQPLEPRFLKDGSFLLTSARTGWRHLYHFEKSGTLKRAVTAGEWEVRRIQRVDEEHGWVYLTGTRDSHIADNFYRARIDGSALERLTREPGSHRVSLSPGAKYFIDRHSSHRHPTRVSLHEVSGQVVRTIDSNPAPDRDKYLICPRELLQITTKDGFVLEASIMKPPGFDPAKKYPVWFMTYAGPHAPTIRDAAGHGGLWDQVLAQSGIIVFRCDPRSASGKGAVSAWTAYRQLGVVELEDIRAAIRWLGKHPWVDAKRIGMSGHSYGGFMTAYAMTHSKLFAAGIAGAPVTDWHDYDTIYTERYMQTPQLNREGYEKTSVVKAAKNLHGRLLLLHGIMDDNVHMQHTTKLVRELQRANRQFELMVYPGSRHGIWGKHYNKLRYDFIRRMVVGK